MLAGRESLLAALHARVGANGQDGPRIVALYGMGGAGKTSLAVEYAHRHQAAAGIVWQFPAEDPVALEAEYGRLGGLLGAAGASMDPRDPVASVHAVLADHPLPWLLLFDNAPDMAAVERFLPPAGNGQVLITSQSGLWPPGMGIEIPVLEAQDAARFLTVRTGDPDADAAAELADELGRLPLALEQAAAYIYATTGTLNGYVSLFRQRRADLLIRGEPSGYSKTVATTWTVAFARLEVEAPSAVELLRLLACLAPEPVPFALLLASWEAADGMDLEVAAILGRWADDPVALADTIAALRRYSLITPAGDGLVLVHRLVQAVTLDQMPAALATAWRHAAATLIETAMPAETDSPGVWPLYDALLPHAQSVLADESPGMELIAMYLSARGGYAAARDLQKRVSEARHQLLGPDDPDVLTARDWLASWTGDAGDPAGARDLYAALLADRERLLGPDHPDTLDTRADVASWTGDAGDAPGARDLLAALLADRERVLGPDHPDTLTARDRLAWQTGQAGDPAGARDLYAALLADRERVLGPDHPDTLATRADVASWTGDAGDAHGARDLYAALLADRERVLGPDHPDTLATRDDVASWTRQAKTRAGRRRHR